MHLQQQFLQSKANNSDELNLRLHRAISWLVKAEQSEQDLDIQFITLWIAFNVIYAKEFNSNQYGDRISFNEFIAELCRLDKDKQIYNLVWQRFPQSIRVMLDNHYVFQPFWDYKNGLCTRQKNKKV